MDFVKLSRDVNYGNYSYGGASSHAMSILGLFFSSDVGCTQGSPTYAEWAFQDKWGAGFSGNAIRVEKEEDEGYLYTGYIFLSDVFPDEKEPTKLKISRQQFVDIIEEWYEKVCKYKPKEVIIKCENGQFFIETNN